MPGLLRAADPLWFLYSQLFRLYRKIIQSCKSDIQYRISNGIFFTQVVKADRRENIVSLIKMWYHKKT